MTSRRGGGEQSGGSVFVPGVPAAMVEVGGFMGGHELDHAQPKPGRRVQNNLLKILHNLKFAAFTNALGYRNFIAQMPVK